MTYEWNDVNITLPNNYEYVLVSYIDKEGLRYVPSVALFKDGVFKLERDEINMNKRTITHWMSLPQFK